MNRITENVVIPRKNLSRAMIYAYFAGMIAGVVLTVFVVVIL
jgi:tetrahydromethanopterin S-methyltransferase subunit F